ncbi:hypothetical protein ACPV4B_00870 [Vibrio parahaemolyticus]
MKEYIDTLNALIKNPAIERVDELTEEVDVHLVKDLHARGFIDAIDFSNKSGLGFLNPKVNIRGREWLISQQGSNQVVDEVAEDIIDLKPNFMGFGVNLNAVFRRIKRKLKKQT